MTKSQVTAEQLNIREQPKLTATVKVTPALGISSKAFPSLGIIIATRFDAPMAWRDGVPTSSW